MFSKLLALSSVALMASAAAVSSSASVTPSSSNVTSVFSSWVVPLESKYIDELTLRKCSPDGHPTLVAAHVQQVTSLVSR
ncbi:hypothetical protein PTI98_012616 [Pleurotus ostreatus]|nr:hypothetical protein PTI98_012616 [Pleurotus ostreatus]